MIWGGGGGGGGGGMGVGVVGGVSTDSEAQASLRANGFKSKRVNNNRLGTRIGIEE